MEVPLPDGMPIPVAAVPANAAANAVEAPLPFDHVVNPTGGWDKMGYSATAKAKDWRSPTVRLATVYDRPAADHLFELGAAGRGHGMLDKQPDELLNPAEEEEMEPLAAVVCTEEISSAFAAQKIE